MKKTFPLEVPGKKAPRVLDSIKHELKKYVKRERRKTLPEDMDYWDFDCRVGDNSETAEAIHLKEINKSLDKLSEAKPESIYVEILAKAVKRGP